MMRIIITSDYSKMSLEAAYLIADQIRAKPDSVLGLATGETPLGTYRELVRMYREEKLDFSRVTTFNLDEYLGLPPEDSRSYHHYMYENLFRYINIKPENIHIPNGLTEDPEAFCLEYEKMIRDIGGIDLQLLGIGRDGHIGFNEPGSSLGSRTRIKTLTEETIEDNARFFERKEDVPRFAITMGVGTIMESRRILLLASGLGKADAIKRAIEGPITAEVTASTLQLHPKVIVIVDEEAASKLKRIQYYRYVERMARTFKEKGSEI